MIKTFTQNDLIRFIYHETSEKEEKEIRKSLLTDSMLKESYNELLEVIHLMDDSQVEPSQSAVLNILAYAKDLQEKSR